MTVVTEKSKELEMVKLYAVYNPGVSVRIEGQPGVGDIVMIEEFLDLVERNHPNTVTCMIENEIELAEIKGIAVNGQYY